MDKNPIEDVIKKEVLKMLERVDSGITDKIMKSIIELEEVKMKFVKDQDFTNAGVIRTAQNTLRDIIKDIAVIQPSNKPD